MSTGRKSALALLLFACLAVRLTALDADPPRWLSWSTGLQTDEGFYTLDARHEALFGAWAPGDFHDRLLSPLLSLLQEGVFHVIGVGTVQARLIPVTLGLLTIALFWYALRAAHDERVALWGALLLGLAPPVAFYNRLALQETPTVFWLVLAFALCCAADRRTDRRARGTALALSGLCVAIAMIFKALAVIALPAFLLAWWMSGAKAPGLKSWAAGEKTARLRGRGKVLHTPSAPSRAGSPHFAAQGFSPGGASAEFLPPLFGLSLALLLYGLLWYAPHHAELARMAAYYRTHQFEPHAARSVWLNVRRGLVDGERGLVPYLLRLLPVPCLLAVMGFRRKAGPTETVLAAWLLGGFAFCLLSSYAPDRYYVLFFPALAGLAALGAARLPRPGQWAALGLFLATSGYWYGQAWAGREHARRDAAQTLTRTLPARSVAVGEMAPALCLDTPFRAAPVQPGLSNDDRPVERLRATAVLVTRVPGQVRWWQAHAPDAVQPSRRILTLPLHGRHGSLVDVYAVRK